MALGAQLRDLIDAFSELVAQHLRLARLELAEDAKYVGLRVGLIAALAPLILVGYGFCCVALALGLRHLVADHWAFLIVGGLNLVVGLGGIAVVARQLQGRRVMDVTLTELEVTTAVVLPRREEHAP